MAEADSVVDEAAVVTVSVVTGLTKDLLTKLEEFRKQYKEENPENKSVADVSDPPFLPHVTELKSLEKAPFQTKFDKMRKQYENDMDTYNNKPAASANDEADYDSDKSKSEMNDEADSDSGDVSFKQMNLKPL
ncbi:hypothetical protein LXL04_014025 [Taraxacum kok-saghyz]